MDILSYNESATANSRIEKFNANPDSNSGILTQPRVIEAGETVTIKSGRQAILADTVIEGDLVIEAGGEVFVPAGANFSDLSQRIDNIQTLPIGAILNGYTIFDNCIVAFGGEFNRADYPKLWAYLQANPTLVKTQAQWQTEATANGGICGFFSDGNGMTTFRVPNLDKAFLRPDSRNIASYQEGSYITGDPNISYINAAGLINYDNNDGLFRGRMNWDNLSTVAIGNTNLIMMSAAANNSHTYSSLPACFGVTRPKNIAVLPLIVAK